MLLQRVGIGKAEGKPLPDPEDSIAEISHIPKPFHISIKEHGLGTTNMKLSGITAAIQCYSNSGQESKDLN